MLCENHCHGQVRESNNAVIIIAKKSTVRDKHLAEHDSMFNIPISPILVNEIFLTNLKLPSSLHPTYHP